MARAGLSEHIAWLRGMVSAGSSDYAVGGVSYWTDDQLQTALDQSRTDIVRGGVVPRATYEGGVLVYRVYPLPHVWVESPLSGSSAWNLVTTNGGVVSGDLYTVDVVQGIITFDADTGGDGYLVDYRAFDLNAAAAIVWEMKTAHFAGEYDIKTDNHELKRSQRLRQAQQMSRYYRGLGPSSSQSTVKRMGRYDTTVR